MLRPASYLATLHAIIYPFSSDLCLIQCMHIISCQYIVHFSLLSQACMHPSFQVSKNMEGDMFQTRGKLNVCIQF